MSAPPGYRPSPAGMPRRQAAPPTVLTARAPAAPPTVKATASTPPHEPAVGESITAGKLRRGEHLRSMYSQGIRISRLNPNGRLIALTLLGYANFQTGMIHARHQPTAEQLADATWLTVEQVRVQLEILRQRGWWRPRPVTHGERAGEPALKLTVPKLVLEQLRARKDARPEDEPPQAS